MRIKFAAGSFLFFVLIYLSVIVWIDSEKNIFLDFHGLMRLLPSLMGMSFFAYIIRYIRWHWLIQRADQKTTVAFGFLAYISGFAFTATPGKVGELMRVRYLAREGIPSWKVIAAFVYERTFDLIVVLLLATLAIKEKKVFFVSVSFVVIFLASIGVLMAYPAALSKAASWLRYYRFRRISRVCITLRNALIGCRLWVTPLDIFISLLLGLLAWSVTSMSFVILLNHLGVTIPLQSALSLYPMAMLAGAASMLPAGIGSTEVTLVLLLSLFGVPTATATLAAVGIRVASLWFAVACGFCALMMLEFSRYRLEVASRSTETAG